MTYELPKATTGYVYIKHPLLGEPLQAIVPTGKKRTTNTGEVEAEFISITKGYYQGKVWLRRSDIC